MKLESINDAKFNALTSDEMKDVVGGTWGWCCDNWAVSNGKDASKGVSVGVAERYNIFGKANWRF